MDVAAEVFRFEHLQDRLFVFDVLYLLAPTDGILGQALHGEELATQGVPYQLDFAEAALSEKLKHLQLI